VSTSWFKLGGVQLPGIRVVVTVVAEAQGMLNKIMRQAMTRWCTPATARIILHDA